jgi:hypothetical protein
LIPANEQSIVGLNLPANDSPMQASKTPIKGNATMNTQIVKFGISKNKITLNKITLLGALLAVSLTALANPDVIVATPMFDASTIQSQQYPDNETLERVYDYMRTSSDLAPSIFVDKPSEKLLRQIYDYALETKQMPTIDALPIKSPSVPLVISKQATSACNGAALTCAAGATVATLVCLASIADLGVTAVGCATGVAFTTGSCSAAVANCAWSNNTRLRDEKVGFKGQAVTGETLTESLCTGENRVHSINFYGGYNSAVSNTTLKGIKLTCTNGVALNYGNTSSTYNLGGSNCGSGASPPYLLQGMDVWSGTLIDAIAPRCDQMFDVTAGDFTGTKRGGTGGSKSTLQCPEGQYMRGMSVRTSGGFVNGISLYCRDSY